MQSRPPFPQLEYEPLVPTRNAIHAYARVLGDCLKVRRSKRKHWWHASLRPSLRGLTTGIVHQEVDFELVLDLRASLLLGETSRGEQTSVALEGQSAAALADTIGDFLAGCGVSSPDVVDRKPPGNERFAGYSADHAARLGRVLAAVNDAMCEFRAGVPEETSPIQVWPHHFDLSMLWLPGKKIAGEDPYDEEQSDKQMNFGFTFGDAGIPEPYFYVTAYPLPEEFPQLSLPTGTHWQTEGFSGAVLRYKTLTGTGDPYGYLLDLWTGLLSAGRAAMCPPGNAN